MWTIKRPSGTTYTRNNLEGLEAGYGADKKGLEAQGWKFIKARAKQEEASNADDK